MRILLACVAALLALAGVAAAGGGPRQLEGVVNVNVATPEQLQLLPGIGPAKVRNILAYRRAHPFRTVEELVRIKGIGRKMVRRLRLHLAVSGPTTAQRVFRPADAPVTPAAPLAAPRPPQRPAASQRPVPRPAAPAGRKPLAPRPKFPCTPANHCLRPP